jgi:hypothetical protein
VRQGGRAEWDLSWARCYPGFLISGRDVESWLVAARLGFRQADETGSSVVGETIEISLIVIEQDQTSCVCLRIYVFRSGGCAAGDLGAFPARQ